MTLTTPSATARTRQILEDLEAVRENLLALSDDIWLSINHNDPEALDAGVEFKRAYNAKAAAFDAVASELSVLVQQYTSVRLEEAEQSGGTDHAENERIIAELNREEPHQLDEDFTYKHHTGSFLMVKERPASRPGSACTNSFYSVCLTGTPRGFAGCVPIPTSPPVAAIPRSRPIRLVCERRWKSARACLSKAIFPPTAFATSCAAS